MIYNFGYLSLINDSNPLETETELIGFQTVSAASLLNIPDVTELNSFESEYFVTELNQSTSSIEDEIDLINTYLNLAETVISSQQNYVYNDIESDNPDYEYSFEYKAADLVGNLIVYRAYYNNDTTLDGEEITTGIMINNEKQYNFNSTTFQDGETNTYQYRIYTNNNNYVEVTDTSNDDFQKFSYQVYKGGTLYNSSEMTVHSYRNNITASMIITNRSNNKLSLEVERNTVDFNNQEMKVKYSFNQGNNLETGEFKVNLINDEETGKWKYRYYFNNADVIIANRSGKGNTKADSDDFQETRGPGNGSRTTTVSTEEETTERGHNSSNTENTNPNSGPGNGKNGRSGQAVKQELQEQMEM
jgi:hypothetical protein